MLAFFVEQHLHHIGRSDDAELLRAELACFAQDLAHDVVANAARGLDLAPALASRAGFAKDSRQ